nr:hypothetical protein CFP56_67383 [Quercus suber]
MPERKIYLDKDGLGIRGEVPRLDTQQIQDEKRPAVDRLQGLLDEVRLRCAGGSEYHLEAGALETSRKVPLTVPEEMDPADDPACRSTTTRSRCVLRSEVQCIPSPTPPLINKAKTLRPDAGKRQPSSARPHRVFVVARIIGYRQRNGSEPTCARTPGCPGQKGIIDGTPRRDGPRLAKLWVMEHASRSATEV